MLPLVTDDNDWVCLQKDIQLGDAELVEAFAVPTFKPLPLADFAETASVIQTLDLVITPDTSVAHLAAAMGKPTWILLPHTDTDFRWLTQRADSPWYASVRLFRQGFDNDRSKVVAAVGTSLETYA